MFKTFICKAYSVVSMSSKFILTTKMTDYDKCLYISPMPTLSLHIHVPCHILVHNPRIVNNVNNLDELPLQVLQIYTEAICNTETVQCDN